MNDKRKGVARQSNTPISNKSISDYSKQPTKRETVLAWLIDESEKRFTVTRFDAEYMGDDVLNTSVSDIERLDGVTINRQPIKRPTRFGKPVDYYEYWIAESELMNARKVLTAKQARRVAA